jgi:hypothetical protein
LTHGLSGPKPKLKGPRVGRPAMFYAGLARDFEDMCPHDE